MKDNFGSKRFNACSCLGGSRRISSKCS